MCVIKRGGRNHLFHSYTHTSHAWANLRFGEPPSRGATRNENIQSDDSIQFDDELLFADSVNNFDESAALRRARRAQRAGVVDSSN